MIYKWPVWRTALLPSAHLCDHIPLIAQLVLPHEVRLLELHLPQNGHVWIDPDPEERGVSTATGDKRMEGKLKHVDVTARKAEFVSARRVKLKTVLLK